MNTPTALLAAAALSAGALAQTHSQTPSQTPTPTPATAPAAPTPPPAAITEAQPYEIQVQPRAWYISFSGDLTMPGAPAGNPQTSLDELNADSPRLGVYGDATIRFDRWSLNLSAAVMSIEGGTTAQRNGQIGSFTFVVGDPIRTSVDFVTGEISAGYRLARWSLPGRTDGSGGFTADLTLLGGARLYDLSIGVGGSAPTATKADEFFAEPIIGGRLEMNLAKSFSVDLQSTAGWMPADHESTSWDIAVAFTWRPVEHLGLQLGYRNLRVDLSAGGDTDFKLNGGGAGLFAGVQLRF